MSIQTRDLFTCRTTSTTKSEKNRGRQHKEDDPISQGEYTGGLNYSIKH